MSQKQTRNIIAGAIIALILIIAGIYYYKNIPQRPSLVEISEPIANENNNSVNTEKGGIITNKDLSGDNTGKFNTAMRNAQIAFGAGKYGKSIAYYNEALLYIKSDKVYSGLFITYGAKKDWTSARKAIDAAIELNPLNADYWIWKLSLLDEQTDSSFTDLKKIYEEGLVKIDPRKRADLTTHFAGIAENNAQKAEAIALWEKAKQINPSKSSIYQAEIDRLQGN